MKFKNKGKLKATLLSATAIATSLLIGMTTACNNKNSDNDDDDKTVTKQDVQVIKNGNFEFYDDNDGLYPISNPDNWTSGSSGSTSTAMGGVINTSKERWDYITDKDLAAKLEANNELDSSDENKKDYNGVLSDDLPYKNTHDATATNPGDEEDEEAAAERKAFIDNPFTHKYSYNEDGDVIDLEGNVVKTYVNEEDGKVYLDEEYSEELETSILMLHNYRAAYYKGTETYYSSSSTVTLPARTAAKVSVWVKTTELYFDGSQNSRTKVVNEHGAYIQVNTTVGGNALDNFYIRNINTDILNPYDEESGDWTEGNNGWVQYTVFVQASSFASTTLTITLGLGQNDIYTVEGYAFFDDIELTTYDSADDMIEEYEKAEGAGEFANVTGKSTANLLSPEAESEFRVDEVVIQTDGEDGKLVDKINKYNSADRHFYIDLTSSATEDNVALLFNENSVAAGLTVEQTTTGKYVSSKNTPLRSGVKLLDNGAGNAFLPANFTGKRVADDILATFSITDDWSFNIENSTHRYDAVLTKALASAADLPGADNNNTALVMLSANGAAYEAELTNESFELGAGEYVIISFWLKTSDMDGKTAATVTVKEVNDKDDNSANFTLDTTKLSGVTINDNEDVYDGWAECFVRVQNTSKDGTEPKQFKLSFNFGNTTINGTADTNFTAGWIAVANASLMKLHENVYGYTSGLENSASLTLSDEEKSPSISFDSEQGDKNEIKSDLAIPNSYTGVNGGSAEVVNLHGIPTDYDETNRNDFAGLLNKENLDNYEGCEWFSAIKALKNLQDSHDKDTIWNTLFGKYSVQPLLIVNSMRKFAEVEKRYNYGYIGNNSSVSSDGYTAVSVRVLVSEGAIANVYLVDTDPASKQVLSFSLPKFTFWYDDDGNVLKGKPKEKASVAELKENIAYTLRSDGLYESVENDGKLYANFYNLSKKFKDYDFEYETFYNEKGELVIFEDLVDGETYYADAQKTAYAPHYLVAGSTRVYKYNAGLNYSTTYYYMVNGAADTSKLVYGLDTQKATLRYDNTAMEEYPYQFTIDARDSNCSGWKYRDKWVTVTFYLHAGSREKQYKLELWSGYREDLSSYENSDKDSYVVFDHSSITLSQTNYKSLTEYYTNAIIDAYKSELSDEQDKLSNNISDYEKQFSMEKLEDIRAKAFNYVAKYYTYTLYDSDLYVPFNADTATGNSSGYDYHYSDYSETLAYLKVEDVTVADTEYSMSMFVDYSNFDKNISLGTNSTVDNDNNTTTTESSTDGTNFWLLLSSILLLAAIVIALLVIIGREVYKRLRRNKAPGKNTYNFTKNKRYVRQYVKANGEVTKTEVEEGDLDESLLTDKQPEEAPVEEEPAEEPVEETPAQDTPAEDVEAEQSDATSTEEAPAEEPATEETPAEENPSQETPAENSDNSDGENKD